MEATSRGTIVVVEQCAAAQESMEHVLREPGHRVLVTRNPLEALELGQCFRIDVPGAEMATLEQDGPALVRQSRPIHRSLSVLCLEDRGRLNAADANNALHAPCSLDELQEAVAAALAGR